MRKDPAPGTTPKRPLWARLGVLVCLLAWFVATPSLLPSAVAGLGSLDGQHRVSFAGQGGKIAVIFQHKSGTQAPAHQHSPLANMLTALAQSSGSTQDHVLTFAQAELTGGRVSAPAPAAFSVPVALLAEDAFQFPVPPSPSAGNLAPRLPPARGFTLICLRSTTLRI